MPLSCAGVGQGHLAQGRKPVLELLAAVVLGYRLATRRGSLARPHRLLGVDVERAHALGQAAPVLVDLQLVIMRVVGLVAVMRDELRGRLARRELGHRDEHLAAVAPGFLDELDRVGHLAVGGLHERVNRVDLLAIRIADGRKRLLADHGAREPCTAP